VHPFPPTSSSLSPLASSSSSSSSSALPESESSEEEAYFAALPFPPLPFATLDECLHPLGVELSCRFLFPPRPRLAAAIAAVVSAFSRRAVSADTNSATSQISGAGFRV